MICQVCKHTLTSMGDANIKYESTINDAGRKLLSPFGISPVSVPSSMKNVEVLYLNKLVKGVGFRNNNGGMQFFSQDFKETAEGQKMVEYEKLRSLRDSLQKEKSELSLKVGDGDESLTRLHIELANLEDSLANVRVNIENLLSQSRQGLVTEEKKDVLRKELRRERNRLLKGIKACKEKLEKLPADKERLDILNVCISHLDAEISDCARQLSVVSSVTIDRPGLLEFPLTRGKRSKSCCLFADMFDYLSYIHVLGSTKKHRFPRRTDSFVMNDIRNFLSLMLHSDGYDHIFCFFPHTTLGETMEKTVIQRNQSCAVSMYGLYEGFVNLHEYVNHFYSRNLLKQNSK